MDKEQIREDVIITDLILDYIRNAIDRTETNELSKEEIDLLGRLTSITYLAICDNLGLQTDLLLYMDEINELEEQKVDSTE